MNSTRESVIKLMSVAIAVVVLLAGTIAVHADPLIHATMDNSDVSAGGSGDTSVESFTVNDASGNNLNGVASGPLGSTQKVISGQAGAIGESLQLLEASISPGLERHIDFGNVANPVPGNGYTASLWFQQTAPIPTAPALLKKGAMASTDKGFGIDLNATSGGFVQIGANPEDGSNENRAAIRIYEVLQTNTWFHVALVLDDDNDVLIGYFNGAGSGNSTVAGPDQDLENGWKTAPSGTVGNGYPDGTSFATDFSLNLGDRWYDARPIKAPFPGYIDDFAVWDRALSPIEIQSLNSLATEENLNYDAGQADLLWQVFAGELADVAIDGTTWEFDATLAGTPGSVVDLGTGNYGLVLGSGGVGGVSTASSPVSGDFNGNGIVDAADYTVWRDNLGGSHDLGGNGDETGPSAGIVDDADYALWVANFGSTLNGGGQFSGPQAVPEPHTWLLGLMAGLALAACGRRH